MKRLFLFAMVLMLFAVMVSSVAANDGTIRGEIIVNPTHTVSTMDTLQGDVTVGTQHTISAPSHIVRDLPIYSGVASRGVVRTQDEKPPPDPREPN